MRKIDKEATKELLERAIRRWYHTYNAVFVYEPIYEDEKIDEYLINSKMEEISGEVIVIDPIFYGKQKDKLEGLEFYDQPIQYEQKIFPSCEKLIEYLLERAEEREIEKIVDNLVDQVYKITDKFQKRHNLEIRVRQDIEENYDGFRTITIFVKENESK